MANLKVGPIAKLLTRDIQLRLVVAAQLLLVTFALAVAGLTAWWYTDSSRVAIERSSRVIASLVQKHIDPKQLDLNDPKLIAAMRDSLKLDDSIYMIAVLDGKQTVVNAVGESAPYAKGYELSVPVFRSLKTPPVATVLIRATANPFELALLQPLITRLAMIGVLWLIAAFLLNKFLRKPMAEVFAASQLLGSQCITQLKTVGLQPASRDLPALLASAHQALVEADQRTQAEVAVRTRALREAYELSLEATRTNVRHARALEEAIEAERSRMALEIHDTLNAQTVALRLYASAIEARANARGDVETADLAKKIGKEMSAMYDTARSIVRDLRPELLDSMGLVGALTQLSTTLGIGSVECKLTVDAEACQSLSDEQAITLYRTAQEATSNIQKHSAATQINIDLGPAPSPWTCRLVVADNGHGFDSARSTESTHGLVGMRERAAAIGGICSITSTSTGTVVTLIV